MKSIERFGVTEEQLRALVAEGLRDGGDWCDLYFEDTSYHDLLLRDGVVGSGGYHVDYGCGIRVLKGEKTGYAYAESTDFASLKSAARAAASIAVAQRATDSGNVLLRRTPPLAGANGPLPLPEPAQREKIPSKGITGVGEQASLLATVSGVSSRCAAKQANFYPERLSWEEAEIGGFVPFLQRIEAGIRARDSRVLKVVAVLSYSVSDVLMYNSLGEMTQDHRPLGSISVQVIFRQGTRTENNTVSRSLRMGAEMIGEEVLEDLVSRAVAGMDARFEAKRPKGGRMPVVMGAGASGILLHEAMGHAFEADFNRKGQSVFSDRMG